MDEYKLTYNKNDSAWNGKFVYEKPIQKGKKTMNQLIKSDAGTTADQSSTSTSHQKSSSKVQSSSNKYVVEIVDGKERIMDKQHHESAQATQSSKNEYLTIKSGTNITPEMHYTQKVKDSKTQYDSAVPELRQPKTKSSEATREIHQVGDQSTSSVNINHGNAVSDSSRHAIRDKASQFIDTKTVDTINKQTDASSSSKLTTSSTENASRNLGGTSSVTTTTTYYDSKGNVVKTVTDVDFQNIPGSVSGTTSKKVTKDAADKRKMHVISDSTIVDDIKNFVTGSDSTTTYGDESYVDTSKIRSQQTTTDSKNYYGHSVDSANTFVKDVYDTTAVQNTIGAKGRVIKDNTIDSTDIIYSNDRNYGKTGWNGAFTYKTPQKPEKAPVTSTSRKASPIRKSLSKDHHPSPPNRKPDDSKTENSTTTTYCVDENCTDTEKIRHDQNITDSRDFYGHRFDSANTMVSNTYDTGAIQNTIGTQGRVIMDQNIDTTNLVFSNDRNYGKTGWNGAFTYETPQKPERGPITSTFRQASPSRKSLFKERSPSPPNSKPDDSTTTTYYVDENYIDTEKIRNDQNITDSRDFYGHRFDSAKTVVSNTYDTGAIQNTIGTQGRVIMDQNIDTTNLVFSNDRNYGKTGWNGKFTYEQPQQPKRSPARSGSPGRKPSPSRKPGKKSPDELPAAGLPSRRTRQ